MKTRTCIVIALCVICLSGCQMTVDDLRLENQQHLRDIEVGMSKLQVMKIMGHRCVKTYYDTGLGRPALPAACNPYKVEIIPVDDIAYEVLFYVMEKKTDDAAITDEELLPMYFEGDILKGFGYGFIECR